MKIELNTEHRLITSLIISIGSTTIEEDITNSNGVIPGEIITQFIAAAAEINQYNKASNVDFVEWVANYLLNDIEHEQLIKKLSL